MSLELEGDIKRLKLTPRTHAWVKREAKKKGVSPQDFVREILNEMAVRQFHDAYDLIALDPERGQFRDGRG